MTAGLGSHHAVKCDRNDCFPVTFCSHSDHNFLVVYPCLFELRNQEPSSSVDGVQTQGALQEGVRKFVL